MTNQAKKSATLIYKEAIQKATTLADIEYIEEKLKTTDKINRRTKQGRAIEAVISNELNKKALEIIKINGITPF